VTSGSYVTELDLDSTATYSASFITNFGGGTVAGAKAALIAALKVKHAYVCVHSATFPGGELRAYPDWIVFRDDFETADPLEWSDVSGWDP
jgi:hypothetical protein